MMWIDCFFFQAEDGIRDDLVTGVQMCALPISMKTAISIDDGLLQEADQTARLMGLSRSRLFSLAVGDFLQRQRREQKLLRANKDYYHRGETAGKHHFRGNNDQDPPNSKERSRGGVLTRERR